jgi:hypothetical protein
MPFVVGDDLVEKKDSLWCAFVVSFRCRFLLSLSLWLNPEPDDDGLQAVGKGRRKSVPKETMTWQSQWPMRRPCALSPILRRRHIRHLVGHKSF